VIRKTYGCDPDKLSDEEWAKLVGEYQYVQYVEGEVLKNNLREVLYELAKAIYGKTE